MSSDQPSSARRSRSRSTSPRPADTSSSAASSSASASASAAVDAAAAEADALAAALAAAAAESDDENWGASDGDEDEDLDDGDGGDGEAGSQLDATGARQVLSAILSRLQGGLSGGGGNGGAARGEGVTISADDIMASLRQHGLVYEDEDGNMILQSGDEEDNDDDEEELEDGEDAEGSGSEEVDEMEEEGDEAEGESSASASGSSSAASASAAPALANNNNNNNAAALAEYGLYIGLGAGLYPRNVLQSLASFQRDNPRPGLGCTSPAHRTLLTSRHIPQTCSSAEEFQGRAFCGKFSSSTSSPGQPSRFATASQDGVVHLYETESWKLYKQIHANEVGWSIVDLDFSHDSRFVIYSSWSPSIQLINTEGAFELHESLDLDPPSGQNHCCMFGIRFSTNSSREILAGLNNGFIILYDIERKRKVWSARGHADDINSVCWLDNSGDLFATGSDDASIRLWDRRLLANIDPAADGSSSSSAGARRATPIGGFLGHVHGLTCVSAMPDGNARYMLSNSKDQSMKLWDLRRMNSVAEIAQDTENRTNNRQQLGRNDLDYRWQRVSRQSVLASASARSLAAMDRSVATFSGHSVMQTLIRCDFSPQHSTGSRYAISGSADGRVYVYDLLTGELVTRIAGHNSIVRDVAWQDDLIVSSSWDHTIRRHALHKETHLFDNRPAHDAGVAADQHARARRQRRGRLDEDEDE